MKKDILDLESIKFNDSLKCSLTNFQISTNNNLSMEAKHINKDFDKSVNITLAYEKDISEIISIIEETCLWLKENGINQWNPEKYLKKYNDKYFLNAILNKEVYIITIEERIIGTFLLKWEDRDIWDDDNNAGYLHHLTIRRNFEGKQLGRITIENIKNIVKAHGKRYLRLDCKASNKKLNQYYINCGFDFKGYFKLGNYRGSKYEIEV